MRTLLRSIRVNKQSLCFTSKSSYIIVHIILMTPEPLNQIELWPSAFTVMCLFQTLIWINSLLFEADFIDLTPLMTFNPYADYPYAPFCGPTDSKEAKRSEKPKENGLGAVGTEPSYFEIPSKDGQMAECSMYEVPTKDTEGAAAAKAAQTNTSFTIEFDNTSPGKVTIKDHVSRSRSKKSQPGSKELSSLQAAIMASESKVADWLAHNNPVMMRRESTEEDSKSIKSDVPIHLKRLKGGWL